MTKRATVGSIPLSLTQQYFLATLVYDGFDPAFQHLITSFEFPAELDAARLPDVVRRIGECYPILNTRLSYHNDEACLKPSDSGVDPGQVFDLRERSATEIDLLLSRFADSPFDLMHGPLWRIAFTRATRKTVITLVVHHLVSDATSGWLVARDIVLRLFGEEVVPAGPPFEEFVRQERDQLSGSEVKSRLEYWAQHLEGAAHELLPVHRPRRSEVSAADLMPLSCAPNTGELLREQARSARSTPLPILISVVSAAAARATGAGDILCGVVTELRGKRFAGTVGPLADLMLVRDRPLAGEHEAQRLTRVRNSVFSGWAQHLPLALLRRELPQMGVRPDWNPCDIFVNLLPVPPPEEWHRIFMPCGDALPVQHLLSSRIGSVPRRFHAPLYLFLFSLTEKLDGYVIGHHRPELAELNQAIVRELRAGVDALSSSSYAQGSPRVEPSWVPSGLMPS